MRLNLFFAMATALAVAAFANLLLEAALVCPPPPERPLRVRRGPLLASLNPTAVARSFGMSERPRSGPAPARPLPLRLLGTLDEHAAALVDAGSGRCRTLRVGDAWDDVELVGVGHGRVTVRRGGILEELGIGATSSAPPLASSSALPIHFHAGGASLAMSREEVLRRLPDVLTSGRLIPTFSGGALSSLKLLAIVPGGVLDQLGLQNGDLLESVNGKPIASLDYPALAQLPSLEVAVNRGGARLTWRLDVDSSQRLTR